ncbi:MAG: hypothetical protein FWG94_11975 [Oscillospiraceae bacterium]|nr:hypothetical protein [Oscillospiraceae bacterium]
MSDFDKQLVFLHEAMRREKIRCICVFACVIIMLASAMGAMFYYIPPPMVRTSEPVTYTHTDAAGVTTTTTQNGRQTVTTVTNADGRVISMSITSGN